MTLLADTPTTGPGEPGSPSVPDWAVLGAPQVLIQAQDAVARRREAELDELLACLAWADLFAADPTQEPGYVPAAGAERLVQLGGEGTPMVRDLVLVEIGAGLCRHPVAVRSMTADALDLRHRLPRTWRHVMDGDAEAWVARKAASMSRKVPEATIWQVDAALAGAITGTSPARVFTIVAAAVILADPTGHRAKLAMNRAKRYVGLGRPDEDTGLRTLVARLTTADAVYVDAMLERVADILTLQRTAAGQREVTRDVLRSEALGWLARPADLMVLLVRHGYDPEGGDSEPNQFPPDDRWIERAEEEARKKHTRPRRRSTRTAVDEEPEPGPEQDTVVPAVVPDAAPVESDPVEPVAETEAEVDTTPASPFALPADVLAALTPEVLARLRPTATLYVHLHQSALTPHVPGPAPGVAPGVARVEGLGPIDTLVLHDLLRHHHVTVKPVIDNRERHAVDAYEHPAWMRERIHLMAPADAFPHATTVSRNMDLDHPVPYDPGGPPGQTTTQSQPLTRTTHRAKTHAGWTCTPTDTGTVWRSHHGLHRLVDNRAVTHVLTPDDAAVLIHGHTALDAALDRIRRQHRQAHGLD